MKAERHYWDTTTISERYNVHPRTIRRWKNRSYRKFPKELIARNGGKHLYCRKEVLAWEEREIAFTQRMNAALNDNARTFKNGN